MLEDISSTVYAMLYFSPASPLVVLIAKALALLLGSRVFRVGNYGVIETIRCMLLLDRCASHVDVSLVADRPLYGRCSGRFLSLWNAALRPRVSKILSHIA